MAKAEDIDAPMTLEVDGSAVSPEKLVRAINAFFDVVRELSPNLDTGHKPEWHVQVKQGSNLIGAYPAKNVSQSTIDYILSVVNDGVSRLEREAIEPEAFNEKALKSMRKLGKISGTGPADDTQIRIWVGKNRNSVTHRTAQNVSQIIEGEYSEYGSVAGRLQTITEKGGVRFWISEELWNHPVQCMMPERLCTQAMAAWRKRVEVYGPIKYRRDGRPVSLLVNDIEQMPEGPAIPSIEDVRGILKLSG